MSQAQNAKNVEVNDAKPVSNPATDTASDARKTLSSNALDLMKEGSASVGKAGAEANTLKSDGKSSEQVAKILENGTALGEAMGGKLNDKIADKMNDKFGQGSAGKLDGINRIEKGGVAMGEISKIFEKKVTDADRTEAKAELEKGINGLVPEADRKLQVNMQNAIVDGDMAKFQEAVKSLGNDPEKLGKLVKEVNDNINKNSKGFSGVELSVDSKGNVLMYGDKGNTAVSVDPKTGEATLKPVERQADGSVVLKDGEIINRKPADVMKDLGDDATRSLTEPHFHKLPSDPWDRHPRPKLPLPGDSRPGVPGGGGKGEFPKGEFPKNQLPKDMLKHAIPLDNVKKNGSKESLDFTPLPGYETK